MTRSNSKNGIMGKIYISVWLSDFFVNIIEDLVLKTLNSSYLVNYPRKEQKGVELSLQNKLTCIEMERSTFWCHIKQNLTWPSYSEELAYHYFLEEDRNKIVRV